MIELLESEGTGNSDGASLLRESWDNLHTLTASLDKWELRRLLAGPYDERGALLVIQAGAGRKSNVCMHATGCQHSTATCTPLTLPDVCGALRCVLYCGALLFVVLRCSLLCQSEFSILQRFDLVMDCSCCQLTMASMHQVGPYCLLYTIALQHLYH